MKTHPSWFDTEDDSVDFDGDYFRGDTGNTPQETTQERLATGVGMDLEIHSRCPSVCDCASLSALARLANSTPAAGA